MTLDASDARPWITWYGDDFTGSAAVMEVLAFGGVETVLFTGIPSERLLSRFSGCKAFGIASTARSHSPTWMEANLSAALKRLDALGAPLLHYKICSTFDSSPETGSIGRAIEIALETRPSAAVPILTAAPQMRRYQAFGNLFSGTFDGVFRLDRHPVMAHHPVTPMGEADLMRHLAHQTELPSALIDLEALWSDPAPAVERALAKGAKLLSIDSMEPASETAAGKLLWENRERFGLVVGSQGIEYALLRHWQAIGMIEPASPPESAGAVDTVAVISGSVSPLTARQVRWASGHGFEQLGFEAAAVCGSPDALAAEEDRVVTAAIAAAERGMSPLVHSASGHDDPAVARYREALLRTGIDVADANRRIGESLGRILDRVLTETGIRRAVISGGDTSGHALGQLNLSALVAKAPTVPGAALCIAHGDGPHDGLEIALKGGQMGSEDYFGWIREGGGSRA